MTANTAQTLAGSDATPRVIDTIAAHILSVRYEDIDADAVALAKYRVLDVLGCAFGGSGRHGNAGLAELTRRRGGAGEATLLAYGGKVPAPQAAFVNAILARSNDLEVMSFTDGPALTPSHTAASTVPVALAVAEANGLSGKDLLTALVIGDDLVARVLLAHNWNFELGADGIGTVVPWGTTAIAGRLLGLDERQLTHAFGLALNMMSGTVQDYWDGVHAFKLVQGTAAQQGITAAELAALGWTGVYDALYAKYGYFKLFADGTKAPEALTRDLGRRFFGESNFKAYPSGLPTHLPIDCALELAREHRFSEPDIESVTIAVVERSLHGYYAKPFAVLDFPQGDGAFSFRYTVATALLRGAFGIEHLDDDAVRDPEVHALIARTSMAPLPPDKARGAAVTVRLKDGTTYHRYLEAHTGDPLLRPMSEEQILAKYRYQVGFAPVSAANAERLIEVVRRLDEVEDLGELTRLASA